MTGPGVWVLAHRRAVLALFALLVLAALPGLGRLELDNSPRAFFPRDAPELARFEELERTFGPSSALRLVVEGEALSTPAAPAYLERVKREAAAVAGVLDVHGARDASPLDRALGFVSRDGGARSLALSLADGAPRARRATLAALEGLAAEAPPGLRATLVGMPTLHRALDEAARGVLLRRLPLLAAISFLLLLATFRELGAVAVPFLFVLTVGAIVFGAMGWLGVTFDLVVAVLPPVLFSIALAVAVHLLIRCRDLEGAGLDAHDATLETFRDKGPALAWTTLSTVVGFGALAGTPVGPIRTLGLCGAFGMLAVGAAAFTLYPCLLAATAGRRATLPERRLELRLERFGRAVAERAADRRGWVFAIYFALALLAGLGLARLRVESNALAYFPADAPVRAAFARAEELGMGLATVELVGTLEAGGFDAPAELTALARLAEALRALPGAISAAGAPDLLDEAGRATPLARAFSPPELRARMLPLVRADATGGRALARFLTADGASTRLTLFVPTAGYEVIDPLVERALAAAREHSPRARWGATGELPLLLHTQHRLLGTLATSLALALPVLGLIFFLLLGELRGALLALVPNVWPVIAILGAMGWLGVPVDLATVMVASIVLGLVVDDTIHTLAPFRELRARVGARRAVTERLEKTAPAFLLTGAVLASGFFVCALSDFAPVARFGTLSVVAIVIALAADLFLVPALFGGRRDE